ncbi:MAG: undecaprenyldiphospho-muramoylpentapeptide beta-N-acetylglucosaminyltransferase [Chitinophagales bacterium]
MLESRALKILISGGGTGGHVFPAIAIAKMLQSVNPDTHIEFVGASDRMEMQKVPEAGYKIHGLWISGFQRGALLKNLLLPFKIIYSLLKAASIISNFKPDVVVGVGGFASAPTLYMAHRKGISTLVQEQNSFAGITNKIMAKRADKFCVAYDGMERFFPKDKIIKTGNPVRQDIIDKSISREEALEFFGLSPDKKCILVVGGSLGAKTINESFQKGVEILDFEKHQLIWQTGKFYYNKLEEEVRPRTGLVLLDFLKRMDMAYAAADVIVSRAGALAISELSLVQKPCILVPSPNVAEDHQTKNAKALVEKEAAIMVKDANARDMLVEFVISLLENEDLQKKLNENIKQFALPNSTKDITKEIIELAK